MSATARTYDERLLLRAAAEYCLRTVGNPRTEHQRSAVSSLGMSIALEIPRSTAVALLDELTTHSVVGHAAGPHAMRPVIADRIPPSIPRPRRPRKDTRP